MTDKSLPDLTPILHGTIGSVAQESHALPAPLLALRRAFTRTLRDYADGTIDRTSVSLRLAALTCIDGDERIWTMGASTGRWYCRSAQARNWTPAHPAQWIDHVVVHEDATASMDEDPAVTHPPQHSSGYGLPESPDQSSEHTVPEREEPSALLPDITRAWLGPQ